MWQPLSAFNSFFFPLHFSSWGEKYHNITQGSSACTVPLRFGWYPGERQSVWNSPEAIRRLCSSGPQEDKFYESLERVWKTTFNYLTLLSFLRVVEEDMSILLLTGTFWQWIFSPYVEHRDNKDWKTLAFHQSPHTKPTLFLLPGNKEVVINRISLYNPAWDLIWKMIQ